ncbi:YjzC family protein [Paenibacillus sp. GCM10023252]|uniref:YjzC family protein n=1 Tax=Paenibacillus sp. GCM10023252 TaxID=3252649 RepID=UPI0036143A99
MGEWTEFEPGMSAPNDGTYMEVGDADFHTGISNPKHVHLRKGEKFPPTSKKDRKWKKARH